MFNGNLSEFPVYFPLALWASLWQRGADKGREADISMEGKSAFQMMGFTFYYLHIYKSRRTKAENHLLTIPNCVSALSLPVLRAIKYWCNLV